MSTIQAKIKSGALEGLTDEDIKRLELAAIESGIRRAIKDNIATNTDGLVVRDIIPDLDFLGGSDGITFTAREWVQPVSGNYEGGNTALTIYKTGANSKYDKKVIVIYGAKQVGTALNKTSGSLSAASITFKKGSSKTIAIADLQRLETDDKLRVAFMSPIIYGKNEEAVIDFYTKTTVSGDTDNIMLLGKVIEPVGENVAG